MLSPSSLLPFCEGVDLNVWCLTLYSSCLKAGSAWSEERLVALYIATGIRKMYIVLYVVVGMMG